MSSYKLDPRFLFVHQFKALLRQKPQSQKPEHGANIKKHVGALCIWGRKWNTVRWQEEWPLVTYWFPSVCIGDHQGVRGTLILESVGLAAFNLTKFWQALQFTHTAFDISVSPSCVKLKKNKNMWFIMWLVMKITRAKTCHLMKWLGSHDILFPLTR